jgi:hypothetical protein
MESRCAEEALRDDVVQRAPQWRLTTYSGGSRYATAIQALRETFGPDDVLFLDYADASSPVSLERAQDFMGLDRVALESVRANESKFPRSGAVARATNSTVARAVGRGAIPARWRERVRSLVHTLNSTSGVPGAGSISAEFRRELLDRHAVDVAAAETVLRHRLPGWCS